MLAAVIVLRAVILQVFKKRLAYKAPKLLSMKYDK